MKQSILLGVAQKEKSCKKYICKLVYLRQLFPTRDLFSHWAFGLVSKKSTRGEKLTQETRGTIYYVSFVMP